ncbi:MAG: diaminopimelate epimerase [Myxococcales bacterium]|nr:diaminopimelate epimerase [Myxococcales bacterium]
MRPWSKYHALGNDYLVVEAAAWADWLHAAAIRRVCDRHLGIGADGVMVREADEGPGRFRARILNPDGSEAEKSGNGLRIFARHLWDTGGVGPEAFEVSTPGGCVTCRVLSGGAEVEAAIGRASFDSRTIPVAGPPREVLREHLVADGRTLEFSAATLGNPHCVLLRDDVSEAEARRLGPLVEKDARFPHRTNVQFARVVDRANLELRIWERGAGYTLASGTSSAAAAAVARRLGLCDASVIAHMPGGKLALEIGPDFAVSLRGPVVKVAEGMLHDEALAGVAGSEAPEE